MTPAFYTDKVNNVCNTLNVVITNNDVLVTNRWIDCSIDGIVLDKRR